MLGLALAATGLTIRREGSAGLVEGGARMLALLIASGGLLCLLHLLAMGAGQEAPPSKAHLKSKTAPLKDAASTSASEPDPAQ